MKLVSATSILLISSSGIVRAALPPGYDTFMHCPVGTCSLYIEHTGFAGPKRAFYKCYDERTDEVSEAVWTGIKTDIEAPEDWIQDPEECKVEQPHKNLDTPGGLCVTDSDCKTTIRSKVPRDPTGPGLCDCYAASYEFTFDETEGQTNFRMARCPGDACDAFEAYCPLAPGDNGMAECALRPIESTPSTPEPSSSSTEIVSPTPAPFTTRKNLDTPGGLCVTDSDCKTTIRSKVPRDPTGPGLCDCYAASYEFTFDETEGQTNFRMARCPGDACDAFEAYCPLAPGDNGMAECALRPIESTPSTPEPSSSSTEIVSPTPAPFTTRKNLDTPGGLCVTDSDCKTTIRSKVPRDPTGPGLCDCYAASYEFTFDETEGQTNFRMARCPGDACDAFEAYCPLAPGDNGMAECALRPIGDSNEEPPSQYAVM